MWLDRNIYTDNLASLKNNPSGGEGPATDLPGQKEMTLKAIDVLHERGGKKGFFLMSEAASIDKQMHALDYDRALGDLLELDDTVRATIAKLEEMGILDETLIVVSADHGHGFGKQNTTTPPLGRPQRVTNLAPQTSSATRTLSTPRRRTTTGQSATPSACTRGRACRSTHSLRKVSATARGPTSRSTGTRAT